MQTNKGAKLWITIGVATLSILLLETYPALTEYGYISRTERMLTNHTTSSSSSSRLAGTGAYFRGKGRTTAIVLDADVGENQIILYRVDGKERWIWTRFASDNTLRLQSYVNGVARARALFEGNGGNVWYIGTAPPCNGHHEFRDSTQSNKNVIRIHTHAGPCEPDDGSPGFGLTFHNSVGDSPANLYLAGPRTLTSDGNLTVGGELTAVGKVNFEGGIYPAAAGVKHKRAPTGSCPPPGCQVSVGWEGRPFANNDYTVSCTVESPNDPAIGAGLRLGGIRSRSVTGVLVQIDNSSDAALAGILHCIAMHD